jgi:hypothetical protein
LCLCPTVGPTWYDVTISSTGKIYDIKRQLEKKFPAHKQITASQQRLSYKEAHSISETWRDMENTASIEDYGIVAGSNIVLSLRPKEDYYPSLANRDPLDIGPGWEYCADDHSLVQLPPSLVESRHREPFRMRHRDMMDGKGIPPPEVPAGMETSDSEYSGSESESD